MREYATCSVAALSLLLLTSAIAPGTAGACIVMAPFSPADVRLASVVVVGRISHYRIVEDQVARAGYRREMWRTGKWLDPKTYGHPPTIFPGDYAAFDLTIDQTLKGQAALAGSAHTVSVRQEQTLLGLQKPQIDGTVMVAMRGSAARGLRLLQPDCGLGVVVPANSNEAQQIRLFVAGKWSEPTPRPQPVPKEFRVYPTQATARPLYPARAVLDDIDGDALVDCQAGKGGTLRCAVKSEYPAGYGFGAATVKLFEAQARANPWAFPVGRPVGMFWRWELVK